MSKEDFIKMIDDLYNDLEWDAPSEIKVDGQTCGTDLGYADDGITFFIKILKERLEKLN